LSSWRITPLSFRMANPYGSYGLAVIKTALKSEDGVTMI